MAATAPIDPAETAHLSVRGLSVGYGDRVVIVE